MVVDYVFPSVLFVLDPENQTLVRKIFLAPNPEVGVGNLGLSILKTAIVERKLIKEVAEAAVFTAKVELIKKGLFPDDIRESVGLDLRPDKVVEPNALSVQFDTGTT